MNIHIVVIPNDQHRPPFTGADWFFDTQGDLQVRVSPMSDWRHEIILALHETVEAVLCLHNGIPQRDVDAFDAGYQQSHPSDLEAGDAPTAPYKREHCLATAVERLLAGEMSVDWRAYDLELEAL
jgi:hypothetical protein